MKIRRAAASLCVALSSNAVAQDAPLRPFEETAENVRGYQVGSWTVDDLGWPEDFLLRVAGRAYRAWYQENFRQVVRDPNAPPPTRERVAQARAETPAREGAIDVRRHDVGLAMRAVIDGLPDGVPSARGFRAPVLGTAPGVWPFELPASEAATDAMLRLSSEGLLATTARAIGALGAERADLPAALRAIGLPIDLLGAFSVGEARGEAIIEWIAAASRGGRAIDDVVSDLEDATFRWRPTVPGFRIASESGEHEFGSLRLQLTRGDDWLAPGDGGSVDVMRQLVEALPDVDFTASIEPEFVETFVDVASQWPLARDGRIKLVVEPMQKITQWAQDSTKPGVVWWMTGEGERIVGAASLAPRYVSFGEVGAPFVQGDTFLLDGLAQAGERVEQSALLFQGGDLMAVTEPQTGARLLLIGEAQLHRNTALGLTREQALEAFAAEFGVDRCVVVPAVSFHMDYEISVRAAGDRLVAFVNDPRAAAMVIIRQGLNVMASQQIADPAAIPEVMRHLSAGDYAEFLRMVGGVRHFTHYPEPFAETFSKAPGDMGAGNLQRFLLAMDRIAALAPTATGQQPTDAEQDYLRSITDSDADREAMIKSLEGLGWKVVRVPSLSEGDRSVNYLNGVHDRTRYLMPAWGGMFSALDEAAAEVFRRELGPDVRVIPIRTSESQRRNGAVRCSVEVRPRL